MFHDFGYDYFSFPRLTLFERKRLLDDYRERNKSKKDLDDEWKRDALKKLKEMELNA